MADSVTNIIHNDERSNVFPLKLVTRQDACSHHLYSVQEDLASAIKQEKERKYAYVRKKMVFISGLYYLGQKSAHFSFKGKDGKYFRLVGPLVSITPTQQCHC